MKSADVEADLEVDVAGNEILLVSEAWPKKVAVEDEVERLVKQAVNQHRDCF